jgi:hypothetical protein
MHIPVWWSLNNWVTIIAVHSANCSWRSLSCPFDSSSWTIEWVSLQFILLIVLDGRSIVLLILVPPFCVFLLLGSSVLIWEFFLTWMKSFCLVYVSLVLSMDISWELHEGFSAIFIYFPVAKADVLYSVVTSGVIEGYVCRIVCLEFWADYSKLIYTHFQELVKSVGSHGS